MSDKFVSTGSPLTAFEREIMTVSMEECAEVIIELGYVQQRLSKALRFGLDEVQPGQDLTNAQRIGREIGDVMECVDVLLNAGIISQTDIDQGRANKKPRLAKYLQHVPDSYLSNQIGRDLSNQIGSEWPFAIPRSVYEAGINAANGEIAHNAGHGYGWQPDSAGISASASPADLGPSKAVEDEIERLAKMAQKICYEDDRALDDMWPVVVRAILATRNSASEVTFKDIAKVIRRAPWANDDMVKRMTNDIVALLSAKPVAGNPDPRLATFRAWLRSHVQFSASAGTNARSVYDTIWAKVAEVFGDERKGERRYRDLNEMTKRKKRGPDRRQSPKPEMRKVERRKSGLRLIPGGQYRGEDRRKASAPPPIATLEAERAGPSREEIAGIIQNAAYREGDYNEPACSWDSAENATDKILALFPDHSTLEAENKRLQVEVERLERYREESKIWGFYEEEYPIYQIGGSGCELASPMTAEEANGLVATIKNLRAELATLRASPLPVSAEELAELLRSTSYWFSTRPDYVALNTAKDIVSRLSASRTEAKAVSGAAAIQAGFQARVHEWMLACFGDEIAADGLERNHRFLEENLELVQACGCSAHEAHQLVDYVFGRAVGEKAQEVGGVLVTLAALCSANGLTMEEAGETELARVWTKIDQIRAKQAAKPKHSPLPMASAPAPLTIEAGPEMGFAWLIEAPGQRYLGTRNIGHYPDFFWTEDHEKATRFFSKEQADGVLDVVKRMAPALFAFATTLGDAWPREHRWINSSAETPPAPPADPNAEADRK